MEYIQVPSVVSDPPHLPFRPAAVNESTHYRMVQRVSILGSFPKDGAEGLPYGSRRRRASALEVCLGGDLPPQHHFDGESLCCGQRGSPPPFLSACAIMRIPATNLAGKQTGKVNGA